MVKDKDKDKEKEKPSSLDDYIKSLSKELRAAKTFFLKETRKAEENFHKAMTAAMHDYEKIEYSKKRVPGALAEAARSFNDRYEAAYQAFGSATKEALENFHKKIEDLIGV